MKLSRRSFLAGAATHGVAFAGAIGARAERNPVRISVDGFGARPGDTDARAGVKAAIARLPRTGGAILHFPPGIYRFSESRDPAIQIAGIDDLTIDAAGCTFLFRNIAVPIQLRRCRNAHLYGFAIDWERPPYSQGEVIQSAADGLSSEIRIDPEFPVDGSESFSALGTYDRALGQMAQGGIDVYNPVNKVALVGRQLLRLDFNWPLPLRAGDTVVVPHTCYTQAIEMNDCDGPEIDSVGVFASCGMALAGARCRNVTIKGFEVRPRPGSARLMSTNADAIHLANGSGTVEIRDCYLTGMGDDCINVHAQLLRLVELQDARTASVTANGVLPFGPDDLPHPGDRFIISRGNTLEPFGEALVAAAEPGLPETLHFSTDLPKDLKPGDLLCNATASAALTVSDCRFPGNRARGVLAHSDAVIENCFFAHQSEQGILLSPDTFWMECGSADRVKIRNNEFHDTVRLKRKGVSAITVGAQIKVNGPQNTGIVHRQILISENAFIDTGGSAIAADAVDDLIIDRNTIERSADPAVALGAVRRVSLTGNRCAPKGVVAISAKYRGELSFADNSGLAIKTRP